ncbi:MAG: hypothetical protein KME08_21495 [Aphanothece sp. CMT-3BRIN-NPC111]|jgi:serine/threonine-protein kinase|nr:hypothetical protein [Aphanothece sp. CMT-3BRIN-NPC111]
MLKKIAKTITSVTIAFGIAPLTSAIGFWTISPDIALASVAQAKNAKSNSTTTIPINTIRLEDTLDASVRLGYFEVPDRNTTVSAFGGQMRRYDVHVARLIALSHHFFCTQPYSGEIEKVMEWEYRANNGRTNMGNFALGCLQVEQAVTTYGLGKVVPMKVQLQNGSTKVFNVRPLDIQGDSETDSFLKFVQTIKPQS